MKNESLVLESQTIDMKQQWLAAHLFYNGDFNVFIRDAIKTFIEKVLSDYTIDTYFFIRYYERGPHIRLRFKGENDVLDQRIKPELIAYFTEYFRQNPSVRPDMHHLPGNDQWLPNDSIAFIPYEPETERYGGPEAMRIAEEQFRLSSKTVLQTLSKGTWSYENALGAAIRMHLSFAKAMGLDNADMRLFFKSTFHGWFYYAYPPKGPDLSLQQLNEQKERVMKAFGEMFDKQKKQLINFHKSFLLAFETDTEFEDDWLNDWITGNRLIKTALRSASIQGEVPSYWKILNKTAGIPADKERLWNIMESYVHMTNNRLGILNRDEAFLGYLIQKSLEMI